jgi:hypothetical protein
MRNLNEKETGEGWFKARRTELLSDAGARRASGNRGDESSSELGRVRLPAKSSQQKDDAAVNLGWFNQRHGEATKLSSSRVSWEAVNADEAAIGADATEAATEPK